MAVASVARPAAAAGLDYKWQVMICTIFGTFGTAIFVTLLQSRNTFHSTVQSQAQGL